MTASQLLATLFTIEYVKDGEVVHTEEGTAITERAVHDLWYRMEFGEPFVLNAVTSTEICFTYHHGPSSSVCCWVDTGNGDREMKEVREERVRYHGSVEQMRPLLEFIYWCYRCGGPLYDGKLEAILRVWGEKDPVGPSVLPQHLLVNCLSYLRSKIDGFILEKYGVDEGLRGAIMSLPRRGIALQIYAASDLWMEDPSTTTSFGDFLREILLPPANKNVATPQKVA